MDTLIYFCRVFISVVSSQLVVSVFFFCFHSHMSHGHGVGSECRLPKCGCQ